MVEQGYRSVKMDIEELTGGVCAVPGVRAYGLREKNKGLALIEGAGEAAGVFTTNKLKAAPLIFTERQLQKTGRIGAIIANSGCANSFTGEEGMRNAERMAELASSALSISKEEVAVASTGPIGKQLEMGLIERQVRAVAAGLSHHPGGSAAAARAIMTTDTFPKECAVKLDGIRIGGIAKGSGMIYPNMATMLSFIYTDARLDAEALRRCLRYACDKSFNMIVVDGDMSTNDMVLLVSTGEEEISEGRFMSGLEYLCMELAKLIARDGEGATKFIEVRLRGASSESEAKRIARAILRSPLVKSAISGARVDLACGRIIAAIGSSSENVAPDKVSLSFRNHEEETLIVKGGRIITNRSEVLNGEEIIMDITVGEGEGEATAWGCDLTCDYVKVNAGS